VDVLVQSRTPALHQDDVPLQLVLVVLVPLQEQALALEQVV
jgi:hypothetical protein